MQPYTYSVPKSERSNSRHHTPEVSKSVTATGRHCLPPISWQPADLYGRSSRGQVWHEGRVDLVYDREVIHILQKDRIALNPNNVRPHLILPKIPGTCLVCSATESLTNSMVVGPMRSGRSPKACHQPELLENRDRSPQARLRSVLLARGELLNVYVARGG